MVTGKVTIGSLFAGIGGLEWGLSAAAQHMGYAASTAWQVELKPYSRAVLAQYWPGAARHADVQDVGRANLQPVSWICGGSPCQDISKSAYRWGRAGLGGKRSGLWSEFHRIINELGPQVVVWENVGGALCVIKEGRRVVAPAPLAVVLSDLNESGYDAWWTTLLAADVGARNLRLRCFLVAYRRDRKIVPVRTFDDGHTLPLDISGAVWPAGPTEARRPHEPRREIRLSKEVPYHLERVEALGNSVVPQCAYAVGIAVTHLDAMLRGIPLPLRPAARANARRTPSEQGLALANELLRGVTGLSPSRPIASFSALDDEWVRCDLPARRASPLCGPWPGSGVMLSGSLRALAVSPAEAMLTCGIDGDCDGGDAVYASKIGMWPTATARDWKSGKSSDATRGRNARPLSEVAAPGGFLNPDWVDRHMGFGAGYTSVDMPGVPQRKRESFKY